MPKKKLIELQKQTSPSGRVLFRILKNNRVVSVHRKLSAATKVEKILLRKGRKEGFVFKTTRPKRKRR